MTEDLYKTLGVNKNATKKDIKKAYRAKAKIHHPDRNGNAELFAEINEAHTILIDDKKRRFYDETGQTDEGSKSQINGIARERLGQFFLGIIHFQFYRGVRKHYTKCQEKRKALQKDQKKNQV
jgi:DnaJ-class molecular chaperone